LTLIIYETFGSPEDSKRVEEIQVDDQTTLEQLKIVISQIDAFKERKIDLNKMRIRDRGGIFVFGKIYRQLNTTLKKEKLRNWGEIAV